MEWVKGLLQQLVSGSVSGLNGPLSKAQMAGGKSCHITQVSYPAELLKTVSEASHRKGKLGSFSAENFSRKSGSVRAFFAPDVPKCAEGRSELGYVGSCFILICWSVLSLRFGLVINFYIFCFSGISWSVEGN